MKTGHMVDPLSSLLNSMTCIKVLSVHSSGDKAMVSFLGKSGIAYTRHIPMNDLKTIKASAGSRFVLGLTND